VRTEEELLALWSAAALQGDSAEESRQRTLTNTRTQFRRYWSLRNAQVTSIDPSTGAVTEFTADPYDPTKYVFAFSADEKSRLTNSGLSASQIADLEAARMKEFEELHKLYGATQYQVNDALIVAQVNAALVASGSAAVDAQSTWSDAELRSPLPKAIFSKSSTDTQTRIEEPNVVGNRVVLRPGGKIGRDEGAVTIDLFKAGGLTTEDQLTIMSAESDDMTLDKTNWVLTVVKKDTFNVLSNRLNVNSNGFVYLGADETDAFPSGGNANLEQVTGNGEIRIKVSGSILNASDSAAAVIQGHKAILEAASGSIGSADKAVTLSLSGGGVPNAATLVARAQEGIWIQQSGDMRVADVYSPGAVTLTAQGAMIDARGADRTRALEAREATLIAQGGAVGSADNPFVVKASTDGGVNATSAAGYSVYLAGAETGLTVKNISSGRDIYLDAPYKDVIANGDLSATGRVSVQATKGIALQGVSSGGDVSLIAYGGDADVQGEITAGGPVDLVASGGISTLGISSGQDITLTADSGNLNVDGDLTAVGSIDVTAGGTGSITMASGSLFKALSGGIYLSADDVGLSGLDAARSVVVVADGDITDTSEDTGNVNASGLGVTLLATGSIGTRSQAVDVRTKDFSKLVAVAGGDAFLSADSASMRISQVSAVGDAVLSSAYSLIDDRATRAQAVDAANIELLAGGDIGATTLPMTVKTAADGAVRKASAGGSVYLTSPVGILTVLDGGATNGQMALNGSAAGLSLGGRIQTARGLALTAGRNAISLTAGADLRNATGSAVLQGDTVTMADGARIDGGSGTLVLSATGDITVTGLSSVNNTAGAIVVSSSRGALLDGGETDADITITSTNGTAVLSAYGNVGNASLGSTAADHALETAAPSLIVTSKTGSVSLAQQGNLSDAFVSARQDADLHGDAKVVATQVSSSLGSVTVSSQSAGVRLASVRSAQDISVEAAGKIELTSFSAPRDLSITTTGTATVLADGQGVVAGALTAGRHLTINAAGSAANSTFSSLLSRAGALQVDTGGTLNISGAAKASGAVDLNASGQLDVGAVSSGASDVDLSVHNGGIRYTSVSAAGVASLSATRGDGSMVATDIRGGNITARAVDPDSAINVAAEAGTVALGNVSATTGGVNLVSQGGSLSTGAIKAVSKVQASAEGALSVGAVSSRAMGVDLRVNNGGIAYSTITAAGVVDLQATRDDVNTAATDIRGGHITARAVDPDSAVNVSAEAGTVALGNVSAITGGVNLVSQGGSLSTGAIKAVSKVLASAEGALSVGAVSSRAMGVDLRANNGGIGYSSITAAGVVSLQATRDDVSTAATDIRGGNITAQAVDPASAINVAAEAGTVALGNVSATTGGVSLDALGGALGVGTVRASADISLGSQAAMNTGALTSTGGAIALDSDAGAMTVASATARTGLDAESGASMSIQSFTVSQGTASLQAATELTLPKGSASDGLTLQAGTHAWLGSLVSSAGRMDVTSIAGGIGFTSLKAATGVGLRAEQTFGSGANPSYSLLGGTLDAGSGGVDVTATTGDLLISRLIARVNSSLEASTGQLRVASIGLLTPGQLTATAGAGTSLPKGY
jgi:hypothetical protein